MSVFADTSLLCALYREQSSSDAADGCWNSLHSPVPLSGLVAFEFRQSTRLQVRLFGQDRTKGFSEREGNAMLEALRSDIANGVWAPLAVDWPSVLVIAEQLSARHTRAVGHRFADILHVATALESGARTFLTFDRDQRQLALACGLEAPLRAFL